MGWTRLRQQQVVIFSVSFLCMVGRHLCLEAWSMVQPDVNRGLGLSSTWLGAMDMTYLYAYSIGNFINGHLGDRFPIRRVVATGLLLASFTYMLAVLFAELHWRTPMPYVILWGFNGLFQSCVWAASVALMSHWFSPEHRGKVIGTWSTNSDCGNIAGSLGAGLLLHLGVSWPFVVLTAACTLACIAVLFAIAARERPSDSLLSPSAETKQPISFLEAWTLPGVAVFAVDFAFVKLLNYGMLFWLPYFLENHLAVDGVMRGMIAASYNVGSIVGSGLSGWLSDRVRSRPLVLVPLLTAGIPLFYSLRLGTTDTVWLYFLLVPLLGWAVSSSANLISGAVATDLAKKQEGVESTATIAGIIDGTGSLGAGLGQLLIGYLRNQSWDDVFAFLMGIGGIAVVLLFPYFIRDLRSRISA